MARIDPREDSRLRTSDVTKFLASCSANGLPPEDLFLYDDLIESTSDCLVRMAKTIIALAPWAETPVPTDSHLLRRGSNQHIPRECGSRFTLPHWLVIFARSNVFAHLVCPAIVIAPTVLPDVQASPTTWPSHGLVLHSRYCVVQRCRGGTRNWYRRRASDAHWDDDQRPQRSASDPRASPFAIAFRVSMMNESSPMSIADSTAEQSIASNNMTDSGMYSSLLDGGRIGSNLGPYLGKSSTIRTITTGAKSFVPSEWPSTTRTEGVAMVASMLGCDDGPGEAFGRSRSSCQDQCQFER